MCLIHKLCMPPQCVTCVYCVTLSTGSCPCMHCMHYPLNNVSPSPVPRTSPPLTAANCNTEAAPYEMIPVSNGKGTTDGVYDVPSEVDGPQHTSGPCAYEVPSSLSTLVPSYKAVSCDNAEENDTLHGEIHYNMGCHDNGNLSPPTATPSYSNMTKNYYQEVDVTSKSAHPLLEVSVLTMDHLVATAHVQCNACPLVPHALSAVILTLLL